MNTEHTRHFSGHTIQRNRLPGRIHRRQIDTLHTDRLRADLRASCIETIVALRAAEDAQRWRHRGASA